MREKKDGCGDESDGDNLLRETEIFFLPCAAKKILPKRSVKGIERISEAMRESQPKLPVRVRIEQMRSESESRAVR